MKDQIKLKIEEFKNKITNIPIENPFDFIKYVEKQKEDNEIDLAFLLELAEENKNIYNQVPVNTPLDDMEKWNNGYFTNGFFSLGDEEEIDTNRFFKDINELAKFLDKIIEKYDDHPSKTSTDIIYRYFRNFKLVTRSDHGRGVNEFNKIQEHKGINCYIPQENGCFLKCNNYIFKKDFSAEYFEFMQSYNGRTNVMTRCRVPEFCKR